MSTPRPVATHPRRDLLPALRDMLAGADDAVMASAFIDTRGIHLIGAELRALGSRGRLVSTSAFRGDRAHAAFAAASELGTRCRVLNPARGTFHPKVVVAHRNGATAALVGSANLTAGLVANVEPRMLDAAWAALLSDGELTNRRLLDELRVHRSSFVCALLARLPGVRIASRRPIRLVLEPGGTPTAPAQEDVAAEARAPFDGCVDG